MSPLQTASSLCEITARQTEEIILAQLDDFVSRGLIVVERGELMLVREAESDAISVRQQITLRLKDKEYIETLEKQIETLKELLGKR